MRYELPIPHDEILECATCGIKTTHHCVSYPDAEYRTCTRCGTKTTLLPEHKELHQTEERRKDRTKGYSDFKRNADRHYRPRNREGEE